MRAKSSELRWDGRLPGQLMFVPSCLSLSQFSHSDVFGQQGSTSWIAFNYTLHSSGLTTAASYPYDSGDGTTTPCDKTKIKPKAAIGGYVRLPANNYTALINAVATVGPISISVDAARWQV